MKKVLFLFLGLLIFLFGIWMTWSKNNLEVAKEEMVKEEMEEEIEPIGGQKDEYGCLSAAGYTWCEEKQECVRIWEDGCDQVTTFLADLAKETEIVLTNMKDAEFEWRLKEGEPVLISGIEKRVENLTIEELDLVKEYLEKEGLEVDIYNQADGPGSSVGGFQKDSLACLTQEDIVGFTGVDWEPAEEIKKDFKISCGLLSE